MELHLVDTPIVGLPLFWRTEDGWVLRLSRRLWVVSVRAGS